MSESRSGLRLWVPLALFALLAVLGALVHEMWRDELEIWLIARDSGSPLDLVRNLKTQGHPALWYILVYLITRVTHDPLFMQLLNVAIGCGTAWLVLRHAPFNAIQRWFFVFGYFLLYEYTIISRNYGLALLLVCLFCARFLKTRELDRLGTLLLFLLANTTLQGAIVASHILLIIIFCNGLSPGWVLLLRDRGLLVRSSIVVVGVLSGSAQVLFQQLAMGDAHVGGYVHGWDLAWIGSSLGTIASGWLPLPEPGNFHIWNSSFLAVSPNWLKTAVAPVLGVAILALAARSLREQRTVAAVFVLGSFVLLCLVLFVWFGSMRHHGQIFLWFFVCAWLWHAFHEGGDDAAVDDTIAGRSDPLAIDGRLGSGFLTLTLTVQIVAAGMLFAADFRFPFSNARAVGEYLSGSEFAGVAVVGHIDYAAQPINAYRPGRIYYSERDEFGSFVRWGPMRRYVSSADVLEDAGRLSRKMGRGVVVVLNYEPSGMRIGDVLRFERHTTARYLRHFGGALVADEDYHVWEVVADLTEGPR